MLITINTFEFGATHPLVGDDKHTTYKYNSYIDKQYEVIVNTDMVTAICPDKRTVFSSYDAALQDGERSQMGFYKLYLLNKDTPNVFYIEKSEYERIKKLCYVDNKTQDSL